MLPTSLEIFKKEQKKRTRLDEKIADDDEEEEDMVMMIIIIMEKIENEQSVMLPCNTVQKKKGEDFWSVFLGHDTLTWNVLVDYVFILSRGIWHFAI